MTFQSDLAYGEQLEHKVLEYLGDKWRKVEGKHAEYDLINDTTGETIECKYDRMALRTGNFCFESTSLSKTTADKLWYSIDGSPIHYVFDMQNLADFLQSAPNEHIQIKRGGDQNHILYLVRVESAELIKNSQITL